MWNGWKKAAIGLSALLAFVVLELVAVIGGVAVFLGLVMDVDLPFRGRPVPHLWGIPADLRCFGSLTPKRQCRAVGEIIKIVMIQ